MIMKSLKKIQSLISCLVLIFLCCVACDKSPDPIDPYNLTIGLSFVEDGNQVHVYSTDHNLMLSFNKEDFDVYSSEHDIKIRLSIESCSFVCQKDEYFSNKIWIIEPSDIIFDTPVKVAIKYTHEEFAPEFKTDGLRIYQLNREFMEEPKASQERTLIRVSDMTLNGTSIHDRELLNVKAEVQKFGSFVIGRVIQ
jgi:hypothetical protein